MDLRRVLLRQIGVREFHKNKYVDKFLRTLLHLRNGLIIGFSTQFILTQFKFYDRDYTKRTFQILEEVRAYDREVFIKKKNEILDEMTKSYK
jgi:hypothetical protein